MIMKSEPCTLQECPPGLFLFGDCLGFKSEYTISLTTPTLSNWPEAFVVASGEVFWGGTKTHRDRAELIVQPVSTPAAEKVDLLEALRLVEQTAETHYTARNGRRRSIEGTDGEMCSIIPFDTMEEVRAVLAALQSRPAEPAGEEPVGALNKELSLFRTMLKDASNDDEVNFWLDRVSVLETAIAGMKLKPVEAGFRPMSEWDRRDRTVLLLVDYSNGCHALDDAQLAITIGHNNDHNVGDGEGKGWEFAGWCWSHDHYVQGEGTPVGWMPLPHHLADAFGTRAECPSAPDGRHQVDTSMESGPNNCFHCEAPMPTLSAAPAQDGGE